MANLKKISKKLGVEEEYLKRMLKKKKTFEKRKSMFELAKKESENKRELIIIFVLIIMGSICMGKALSFNKEYKEKIEISKTERIENLEKRVNDLEVSAREYRMEEGIIYSQIKVPEEYKKAYMKMLIKAETQNGLENKDIPELKTNYLKPISKEEFEKRSNGIQNTNEDSLKPLEGTEINMTTGMYGLEINEDKRANGYQVDPEAYIEKLKEHNKMLNMSNEKRFEEISNEIQKQLERISTTIGGK